MLTIKKKNTIRGNSGHYQRNRRDRSPTKGSTTGNGLGSRDFFILTAVRQVPHEFLDKD